MIKINIKKNNLTNLFKEIFPGLLVSTLVALISIFIGQFIPELGASTIAIFLGMALGNTILNRKVFFEGYKFSESNLLSYSIVLLGGTLNINTLMDLGISGVSYIILQMTITIVAAIFIGKKLGFQQNFTYLMASGNAVCGSSAIGATAPVINASEDEKGISITIVNVTGVFLMLLLPILSKFLYNHELVKTSAIIGGTLQSVGQVVASGSLVNENVKELSAIFKIVRIIFLVFVVFILGTLKNKSNEKISNDFDDSLKKNKKKIKIPWYVIGFFITCTLFTIGFIPTNVSKLFKTVSNNFEIIALAAIGLKVNFKELIKQGKKVSLYGLAIGLVQIIAAILLIKILL